MRKHAKGMTEREARQIKEQIIKEYNQKIYELHLKSQKDFSKLELLFEHNELYWVNSIFARIVKNTDNTESTKYCIGGNSGFGT